ncbi:Store-operated calcium entry-associated regulatory factor [Mactra antiquata]
MESRKKTLLKPVLMVSQLIFVCTCLQIVSAAKSDRVLLNDVKAITLHHGQMTNARRSEPVPQLKCVGGTAGCSFRPQTVQCTNKGSDGFDIQWECKTDMDNKYKFGQLEVTCEGYDYPEDPYILRGSCGLEYTLDYTEEGWNKKNSGHHGNQNTGYQSHHYNDDYHDRSNYHKSYSKKASSVMQDLVFLGIIAAVIYVVYKTCIASSPEGQSTGRPDAPPSYEETFRNQGQGQHGQQPPPYGFRQDYMPNNSGMGGGSCSSDSYYNDGRNTRQGTGGGFWSGAFTGGLMGYLLGNRNHGYYNGYQRRHTGWGNSWGTGWGNSGGWGNNWGSNTRTFSSGNTGFSSSSSSSGTRTTSGFASTKRR